MNGSRQQIRSLVLVYNAEWSVSGALRYVGGFLKGANECPLCETTHGAVAEKREWRSCKAQVGVPVEYVYRNAVDKGLQAVLDGEYPAVAAKTEKGYVRLLGRSEVEALKSDVAKFYEAVRESARREGLSWP